MFDLADSKATVIIGSDNRSWELEGREEVEGRSNDFILKAEGPKEANSI